MFDPTTFPTAIPAEPLNVACIEAKSSGEDVPIATTVSPTIRGVTFAFIASPDAYRTRISPPNTRMASPTNSST